MHIFQRSGCIQFWIVFVFISNLYGFSAATVLNKSLYRFICLVLQTWKVGLRESIVSNVLLLDHPMNPTSIQFVPKNMTVHKICQNTGFFWPVFSRIRAESSKTWENPYSDLFYAVWWNITLVLQNKKWSDQSKRLMIFGDLEKAS